MGTDFATLTAHTAPSPKVVRKWGAGPYLCSFARGKWVDNSRKREKIPHRISASFAYDEPVRAHADHAKRASLLYITLIVGT